MDCINSTGKLQGFTAIQHNGFSSLPCGGGTGPGDRAASLSSLCAGKLRRSGSDFSLAVQHPPVACIALFKRQLATIRKFSNTHCRTDRQTPRVCGPPWLSRLQQAYVACLLACLTVHIWTAHLAHLRCCLPPVACSCSWCALWPGSAISSGTDGRLSAAP